MRNLYVANCPTGYYVCRQNSGYPQIIGGSVTVYGPGKTTPAYSVTNGVDGPDVVTVDASNHLYVSNIGTSEIMVYPLRARTPLYAIWLNFGAGVTPRFLAIDVRQDLYACCDISVFPFGSGTSIEQIQPPTNDGMCTMALEGTSFVDATVLTDQYKQILVLRYKPHQGLPIQAIKIGSVRSTCLLAAA